MQDQPPQELLLLSETRFFVPMEVDFYQDLMIGNVLLPAAILSLLYGLAIGGLIWLLRRLRVGPAVATGLGFLLFGAASGLLVAWLWPLDSCVYPNFYTALLGDAIYQWSAEALGDPWLLRVPQVYPVASTLLGGAAGLLAAWAYRWIQER